jgi:hypothetical protein
MLAALAAIHSPHLRAGQIRVGCANSHIANALSGLPIDLFSISDAQLLTAIQNYLAMQVT